MKWRKLGHIFVANGQSDWMRSHGTVPFASPLGDYVYRVYFTPRDVSNRSSVCWLDIDIRKPTEILRLSKTPLLAPGEPGTFDDSGAMGCWIVARDGVEWLYYQGWNLGVTVPFHVAIGVAQRPVGDPDRPFERVTTGPILDRSATEPFFVTNPAVLSDGSDWRMWYLSGRAWTPGAGQMLPSYDIRSARSSDGLTWQLDGRTTIGFEHPGEVAIARFSPLREVDGSYSAWYCYRGNDWGYVLGYATSADGETWQRQDNRVGIAHDPSGWEGAMMCYPFVFDTEIGRMMLYNGGRYGDAGFGIAVLESN